MELILPKTDLYFSAVNEINQLCEPLRPFGITAFSHTKIYDDGTFIDMADNTEMIDHFYYSGDLYKDYPTDMYPHDIGGGFFLYSTIGYNKSIHFLREHLNMDNIIVYIERGNDCYETWNFASKRNNRYIINFYLNNLDKLKSFIDYFKSTALSLIKKFDANRIIRVSNNLTQTSNFLPNAPFSFCHPLSYLTKKELECLYWVCEGKSAKEIAELCCRSTKTIQNHLQSIRQKLNCKKISFAVHLFNQHRSEKI